MSSILRALKKLDEDAHTREHNSVAGGIKINRAVAKNNRPQKFNYRMLSLVLVVLLIAAFAWIFIDKTPVPVHEQTRVGRDNGTQLLVKRPVHDEPAKRPVSVPKVTKSPARDIRQSQPSEVQPVQNPQLVTKPPTVPQSGNAAPIPPHPPSRPAQTDPKPDPTVQTATVQSNTPSPLKQKEAVKRPQFTFRGVLWSEKPERRVALINDRYLKEGDTISGVTVVKIEKNSVSLRLGDDTWKLRVKK